MGITKEDILAALDNGKLRYSLHEVTKEPVILFSTDNFRNDGGSFALVVVISVTEEGEYIKFFVPSAYHIPEDESAYAVLKSFSIIAWQVKMLDFEVDPSDGEVRPTIDFPLEDGTATEQQLIRCCKTLAQLVDIFDPYIKHALLHNEVHDALLEGDIAPVFNAYHKRKGDAALDSLRERFGQLRDELEIEEGEQSNEESDNPNDDTTGNTDDDTPPSKPTGSRLKRLLRQKRRQAAKKDSPTDSPAPLDTSDSGDDEPSDDEWI